MNIEGWDGSNAPLDYVPDDDPPYNRCPFCMPVIAAILAAVAVATGYGLWFAAGALAAWVAS